MKIDTVLCLDIGNTRLKWAECRLSDLRFMQEGVVDNAPDIKKSDFDKCFGFLKVQPVWVSLVSSGDIKPLLTEWFDEHWDMGVNFIRSDDKIYKQLNCYKVPSDLGVDRLLAMIAGKSLVAKEFCVADLGTAVTLDVVDSKHRHIGGMIMPGKQLMLQSLCENTANIETSAGINVELADSTANGVETGVTVCLLGGLERALRGISDEYPGIKIIVTGGDVKLVEQLSYFEVKRVKNLVLQGVGLVARKSYA